MHPSTVRDTNRGGFTLIEIVMVIVILGILFGVGLIAFASLFPMITVMGYAQISTWRGHRARPSRRAYD